MWWWPTTVENGVGGLVAQGKCHCGLETKDRGISSGENMVLVDRLRSFYL
jgi:hypothetical protein